MESSASAGRVASAVLDPRRWWALALLCGAVFMVPLGGTLSSRPLAGADALTILIGTVAVGTPFVLTLYAQQVLGYSAPKFGISSVVLTQVSIHGSYFPDIFIGLLLCGLGIGLAFVTATVAALARVAGYEAGLASGLTNTALQTGTALGVAIVTTVAVSRF
jgi:hypothetical protein